MVDGNLHCKCGSLMEVREEDFASDFCSLIKDLPHTLDDAAHFIF